ncbi:MAG: hypothetical protein COA42_12540 [Alteromonadaceae bacterium]|nr:MAG: hypothetical protein COA42_12540 [Alteromonadaceae bacterium]
MNLDPNTLTQLPVSIDLLHLVLSGLVLLLVVLLIMSRQLSSKLSNQECAPKSSGQAPTASRPRAPSAVGASTTQAQAVRVNVPSKLDSAAPDAALQLLALLQQEARFIDFTQEDISELSDSDIGGVARVVHEGCKKTLDKYLTLVAIRDEEEESAITVAEGFDPAQLQLTGNVVGEAPYKGTLIHRGWKVSEVSLPKLAKGHNTRIVARAEVEL